MATPEPGVHGLQLPSINRRLRRPARVLGDVLLPSSTGPPEARGRAVESPSSSMGGHDGTRPGTVEIALRRLQDWKVGVSSLTAAHNLRTLDPLKMRLDGDDARPRPRKSPPRGSTYLTERDATDHDLSSPISAPEMGDEPDIHPGGKFGRGPSPKRVTTFTSTRARKPLDAPTGGRAAAIMSQSLRRGGPEMHAVKAVPEEDVDSAHVERLNAFLGNAKRDTAGRGNEGYVARRVRRLQGDPIMHGLFREVVGCAVAEDYRKRREGCGGDHDIVRRNKIAARMASPERRREHLREASIQRDHRVEEALERHQHIVDTFSATAAADGERRKEARTIKLQAAWLPCVAFAARTGFLGAAVEAFRGQKEANRRNKAATLIQRRVRIFLSGHPPVTGVRAAILRARFLRRVATRARVRLREVQIDRIRALLQTVATSHPFLPIYLATRKFARAIVVVQRHVRRGIAQAKACAALRAVQWHRCKEEVEEDHRLVAKRGGLEGATTAMVRDAARATRELAVLASLPDERRDAILNENFAEYKAKFTVERDRYRLAALRWCKDRNMDPAVASPDPRSLRKSGARAPLRRRLRRRQLHDDVLPDVLDGVPKPVFRQLVPKSTLAMMVRSAAREGLA